METAGSKASTCILTVAGYGDIVPTIFLPHNLDRMPKAPAEAIRTHVTRHVAEFMFSSTNRMDLRAGEQIAKMDPDLSVTHDVVQKFLDTPFAERPPVLQEQMLLCLIHAGQYLMTSERSTDEDHQIPARTTRNHVRALRNIVDLTESIQDETIHKKMQNSLLTLFADATSPTRSDLVSHPEFPWTEAVDQAVNTPFDLLYRRFGKRLVILQHAPTDILAERSLEYAKTHTGGVPMILFDEFLQTRDIDYLQEKGFYDLMAAMPTGDKQTALGVLEWALKVTSLSTFREREHYGNRIPEAYVHILWDALEKQWMALSYEDKNTFLHAGVLHYVDDLWHNTKTTLRTSPLARSHELVHTILASLSHEGHDMLIQNFDLVFQEYPFVPVPSVLHEVLPRVAQEIEARRPRK